MKAFSGVYFDIVAILPILAVLLSNFPTHGCNYALCQGQAKNIRVTIPASVREEINLHEGDTLEAKIEDGHIVLIPQQMMARETGRKPVDKKDQPLASVLYRRSKRLI